jgi:outer membrane protein OmpA-like peptidoglycan-associated protein
VTGARRTDGNRTMVRTTASPCGRAGLLVCLVAVTGAFAPTGCATPPKPPELDAFEQLRKDPAVEAAGKRNADLITGADGLLKRAREQWQGNDLPEARHSALLGQIKLKQMVAVADQDQARKRIAAADADLKLLAEERVRLDKDLAGINEQLALLRKLQEATQQLTAEQKRAAAADRIADAELAIKTADTVNATAHAKSLYTDAVDTLARARQELAQGNFPAAQAAAESAAAKANQAAAASKPLYEQETQAAQNRARAEALARDAAALAGVVVRREARGPLQRLVIPIAAERLFTRRDTSIASNKEATLDPIAEILKKYPTYPVQVVGHTDNRGRAGEQLAFSLARAESVFSALVLRGVEAKRMVVSGQGSTEPIADNRTAQGRTLNNRVEIVFLYQ